MAGVGVMWRTNKCGVVINVIMAFLFISFLILLTIYSIHYEKPCKTGLYEKRWGGKFYIYTCVDGKYGGSINE